MIKGIPLIGDGKFDEFWDEWLEDWKDKEGPYTFTKDHFRNLAYYAWYRARGIERQGDRYGLLRLQVELSNSESKRKALGEIILQLEKRIRESDLSND